MKRYDFHYGQEIEDCCIDEALKGVYVKYEEVAKILRGAKILLMAAKATCVEPTAKRIEYFLDNSLKEI